MANDVEEMGPIDYVVIEFPGNKFTGEAFPALMELVDRGLIRILDLLFIRKELDGATAALSIQDLGDEDTDFDVKVFEGASSGLLGDDDIAEAAEAIEPGSSAGLLDLRERLGGALRRRGPSFRRPAGGQRPYPRPSHHRVLGRARSRREHRVLATARGPVARRRKEHHPCQD